MQNPPSYTVLNDKSGKSSHLRSWNQQVLSLINVVDNWSVIWFPFWAQANQKASHSHWEILFSSVFVSILNRQIVLDYIYLCPSLSLSLHCSIFLYLSLPIQHTVEVLSLLSDEAETDDAGPGENLKLRLKGIEEEEILPGFILCNAENLCHSGRTFDAQVSISHSAQLCLPTQLTAQ